MRTQKTALSILAAVSLLQAEQPNASAIRGYPPEAWAAQHQLESQARAIPQAERIRTYLERMSAEPHVAGSPGSRVVAEYANALLKEWGLDSRIESFEALLPYPVSRTLEMTAPTSFRARLAEPPIAEDKDSSDANQIPTYNAFSATGDVTAPVVYVNYGMPDDYEVLRKLNVDVKGKIVIARYGGGWRGIKPKLAQENGAVGCLIYSDPRDDGYFAGEVYPEGPYRPSQGVQRGSVLDMPLQVGDPLTPGWASEKGTKRLAREESKAIMRIPVLPISYGDAAPFLKALRGPVAPENWRGALGFTYHIGPGPATAHLKLDFDWTSKPIHNVVVRIPGTVYKDQWVILGNHHDAWVNGASDPLSGASSLLETARTFSKLLKQGWKPKRTIILALWDGEEFGLMGSTEWAEKHKDELAHKGVAYINTDSNGKGSFSAGGSHALEQFLNEILRDVKHPSGTTSILDAPRRSRGPGPLAAVAASGPMRLGALGAGSDYVAFFHHIGISSFNVGFGGEGGGVYHSAYDTLNWFLKFSDGDLSFGRALTQVTSTMAMRLADAPVLPYQFNDLARTVKIYMDGLQKDFPNAELKDAFASQARLATSARAFEEEYAASLKRVAAGPQDRLVKLNAMLFKSERALLAHAGLPGREWYKHTLYAPGQLTGYGAKTLPGVRETLEQGRTDVAREQVKLLSKALKDCAARIEDATQLLRRP